MLGTGPRSEEDRRYLHCGWMSRRDWLTAPPGLNRPRVPATVSGVGDGANVILKWAELNKDTGESFPDVCPGWAVRQPLINEICKAHASFAAGAFGACYPNPSNVLVEGVLEMKRSFDEYSRQLMAQLKESTSG